MEPCNRGFEKESDLVESKPALPSHPSLGRRDRTHEMSSPPTPDRTTSCYVISLGSKQFRTRGPPYFSFSRNDWVRSRVCLAAQPWHRPKENISLYLVAYRVRMFCINALCADVPSCDCGSCFALKSLLLLFYHRLSC